MNASVAIQDQLDTSISISTSIYHVYKKYNMNASVAIQDQLDTSINISTSIYHVYK